jgi:hypothetical protein
MPDKKISQYTPSTKKIPKGTDLVDFSEDDGAGGFDTVSRPAKDLVDVVAETLAFNCDAGNEGTVSMDWNCIEMRTAAYRVSIVVTSAGKTLSGLEIQIGSTSGASDIMPPYLLTNAYLDAVINVPLTGVLPTILSDSGTYFLTLVTGISSGTECDIKVHADYQDV